MPYVIVGPGPGYSPTVTCSTLISRKDSLYVRYGPCFSCLFLLLIFKGIFYSRKNTYFSNYLCPKSGSGFLASRRQWSPWRKWLNFYTNSKIWGIQTFWFIPCTEICRQRFFKQFYYSLLHIFKWKPVISLDSVL